VTEEEGAAARLARLAADRPGDPAIVVDGGDGLTFDSWERRSTAVARGLSGRGVAPGDRIALRFDAEGWPGFAVAYVGVLKAGAVAVLVPAGLAPADAGRILRHSGAVGLVRPAHLALLGSRAWGADEIQVAEAPTAGGPAPKDVAQGHRRRPAEPAEVADLAYPLAPLARPAPLARRHGDGFTRTPRGGGGALVHAWAPGSVGGQRALAAVLAGTVDLAASVARFSPAGFCGLVARLGATACGLTPALAAALSSPGSEPSSLGSVTTVVVSPASGPSAAALAGLFPRATMLDLDAPADSNTEAGADRGPLCVSQVGMVWHEQLAPGSFNLPCLVRRYRGRLDMASLEQALVQLLRRHEPLRTTFELVDGAPLQVVGADRPRPLAVVDLSHLAVTARDGEAGRRIAEATARSFDLVDGPLFAPLVVRLGQDDHLLVVRLHHTAFDDWSVDVFRRQLSALYAAEVKGEAATLPEPATRFVDACRDQHARIDGKAGDEQRAWWREQMKGAPLAVQLPLGDASQIGPDERGAGLPLRHDLPPQLADQVRALAPRLRATPFMTVLAAFGVLLSCRTAQDDLVIASVVAGRDATRLEPMIGCFTRKVLLRLRLDGDPTFPELVARSRAAVLGALAHQDLPFEAVVQDTLGRTASVHGLAAQVPVVFQGETPQRARLILPGLDVGPYEVPASARRERHFSGRQQDSADTGPQWGDGAYLDTFLLLSLLEGDGLALVARGAFDLPATQRLLEDLEALLAGIVAAPDRRLSDLLPLEPSPSPDGDDLVLHGLRLRRSWLEAALSRCPGVADVGVAVTGDGDEARLVAYVVAGRRPPPTLAELRHALWKARPGSPWPAAAVLVESLPRLPDGRVDEAALAGPELAGPPDPDALLLTKLWATAGRRDVTPGSSYWQDFSFLQALAEARAAGLPITDEQVARCRTPEMLAAALASR
jgi:hypothetical protein